MSETEAGNAVIVEPSESTGLAKLGAFARRMAAVLLGIVSMFLSLLIASFFAAWLYDYATDNRNYFFFGFTWRSFLQASLDFRSLIVFIGVPILALGAGGLARLLVRPDYSSGELKKGRSSWTAVRFAVFGIRLAIVNLAGFAVLVAYRIYEFGYR